MIKEKTKLPKLPTSKDKIIVISGKDIPAIEIPFYISLYGKNKISVKTSSGKVFSEIPMSVYLVNRQFNRIDYKDHKVKSIVELLKKNNLSHVKLCITYFEKI